MAYVIIFCIFAFLGLFVSCLPIVGPVWFMWFYGSGSDIWLKEPESVFTALAISGGFSVGVVIFAWVALRLSGLASAPFSVVLFYGIATLAAYWTAHFRARARV